MLVTFAVAQESRPFRQKRVGGVRVVHTGIGGESTREVLRHALREPTSWVISSGFAGALDPVLRVGDLVADESRSSPELLKEIPAGTRCGRFHCAGQPIATPAERDAIWRSPDRPIAVDMESDAVAEVCREAGVPLLILRSVSDAVGDSIPVPLEVAWDFQRQRPRAIAVAAYLLRRSGKIAPFITFLRNTRRAAGALGAALPGVIASLTEG